MPSTVFKVMRTDDGELSSIFLRLMPFKTVYPIDCAVRAPKGNIGFFAYRNASDALDYASMIRARFSYNVDVYECEGTDPKAPLWIAGATDARSIQSFLNTMDPVFNNMTARDVITRIPLAEMKAKGFRYLIPVPPYQESIVVCTHIKALHPVGRTKL